ncbi:MAG TPA: methyltransferase domain-containing protein [Candidatus Dormibacteraeota bacterium]|nr:methyltransferase domain-containing protein [Candidatus Dormibacteraeota bacterium]
MSGSRPGPHLACPLWLSRLVAAAYDLGTRGMERELFGERRRRLLGAAAGEVLDVGGGTGANLPHLPRGRVTRLVLLDPSPGMLARARGKARELGVEAQLVRGRAEWLPFPAQRFDAVVFTLSLCTIGDPAAALEEARRVLRPGGRLLVLEHVRAASPGLARWQDRLTPLWRPIGGGCHLNRDTRATIEAAGFRFEAVEELMEERIPIPVMRPQLIGVALPVDRVP